jgi:hypothetical protein
MTTSQRIAVTHLCEMGDEQQNPVGSRTFHRRGPFFVPQAMLIITVESPDNLLLTASMAWRDKLPLPSWIVYTDRHGAFLFPASSLKPVNGKLFADKMADHHVIQC